MRNASSGNETGIATSNTVEPLIPFPTNPVFPRKYSSHVRRVPIIFDACERLTRLSRDRHRVKRAERRKRVREKSLFAIARWLTDGYNSCTGETFASLASEGERRDRVALSRRSIYDENNGIGSSWVGGRSERKVERA